MMQRACRPTSLELPETSLMDVAGQASPPPLRRMPRRDLAEAVDLFWWSQATHLASRDPLDRPAADSELLGDLVQTWAPRCSQRVTDALF